MRRCHRFFLQQPLIPGSRLRLPAEVARQVASVLRLRLGDRLVLFNGDGRDVPATLTDVSRADVTVELGEPYPALIPPPPAVTLALAGIRADRFAWALQKATELGVAAIVPLETARTVVPLRAGRMAQSGGRAGSSRLDRWHRIAVEAAEQCGRGDVPRLHEPLSLAALLADPPARTVLLAEEEPRRELAAVLPADGTPLVLVVGPEGGFTPEERQLAADAGAVSASLGPLILRSETAAVAAVAFVRALASAGLTRDSRSA